MVYCGSPICAIAPIYVIPDFGPLRLPSIDEIFTVQIGEPALANGLISWRCDPPNRSYCACAAKINLSRELNGRIPAVPSVHCVKPQWDGLYGHQIYIAF